MHGDLVYFMVPVRDPEKGKAFYGSLLGWQFEPGNVPGGFQVANSTPPGGLFGGGEAGRPEVWFEVDDIEAALARVRKLGGESGEPQEIESGVMAGCHDDQGTAFNLWSSRD